MLIYTSYFAQVKNLPSDIVPISIAAKQVPGWRYPVYKALAPTYDYKRDGCISQRSLGVNCQLRISTK